MMAPDVVYDALLANERSLDDPQIIDVEPGETVAIRWLAGSALMSFFLDLGELEGELLRTDANPAGATPTHPLPAGAKRHLLDAFPLRPADPKLCG